MLLGEADYSWPHTDLRSGFLAPTPPRPTRAAGSLTSVAHWYQVDRRLTMALPMPRRCHVSVHGSSDVPQSYSRMLGDISFLRKNIGWMEETLIGRGRFLDFPTCYHELSGAPLVCISASIRIRIQNTPPEPVSVDDIDSVDITWSRQGRGMGEVSKERREGRGGEGCSPKDQGYKKTCGLQLDRSFGCTKCALPITTLRRPHSRFQAKRAKNSHQRGNWVSARTGHVSTQHHTPVYIRMSYVALIWLGRPVSEAASDAPNVNRRASFNISTTDGIRLTGPA